MMMKTHDDTQAIRENLQRWRDTLKATEVEPDTQRALRELIVGAEKRLHEIER